MSPDHLLLVLVLRLGSCLVAAPGQPALLQAQMLPSSSLQLLSAWLKTGLASSSVLAGALDLPYLCFLSAQEGGCDLQIAGLTVLKHHADTDTMAAGHPGASHSCVASCTPRQDGMS